MRTDREKNNIEDPSHRGRLNVSSEDHLDV